MVSQHLLLRVLSASAGALLAVAVAGCSSHSSNGLTVSGLHDKARAASGHAVSSCPVAYDIGKAVSKAGVHGAAALESGSDAVTVVTPENAEAGSAAAQGGVTEIECDYVVGTDTITVHAVGSSSGGAVGYMLPVVQAAAHMSTSELAPFVQAVQKAKAGTATVAPNGGGGAAIRLPVSGAGDLALVVTAEPADTSASAPAITATQLAALTRELAAQTKW